MSEEMMKEYEAAFVEDMVNRCGEDFRSSAKRLLADRDGNEYANPLAYVGWWSWRASRAAVVVNLPNARIEQDDSAGRDAAQLSAIMADRLAIGECRVAVEAAGLRWRHD